MVSWPEILPSPSLLTFRILLNHQLVSHHGRAAERDRDVLAVADALAAALRVREERREKREERCEVILLIQGPAAFGSNHKQHTLPSLSSSSSLLSSPSRSCTSMLGSTSDCVKCENGGCPSKSHFQQIGQQSPCKHPAITQQTPCKYPANTL